MTEESEWSVGSGTDGPTPTGRTEKPQFDRIAHDIHDERNVVVVPHVE